MAYFPIVFLKLIRAMFGSGKYHGVKKHHWIFSEMALQFRAEKRKVKDTALEQARHYRLLEPYFNS